MENSDIGLSNLSLNVHSSQKVNEVPVVYLLANLPMLATTIAINMWVIRVIQRKEKSRLNRLIVWDCFANILSMALMLLIHSPLLPLSSAIPCTILVFVVYTMTWNQGDIKLESELELELSRKGVLSLESYLAMIQIQGMSSCLE